MLCLFWGGRCVVLLLVWWYRMMLIGVIDENGGVREEWYVVDGMCILWCVMIRELDMEDRVVLFFGYEWSGALSLDNSDLVMVFIWMGTWCRWYVIWRGFRALWRNDHFWEFPQFWLDFHHFRCGSSLFPCSHSDNALSNTAERALRWMGSGCCGLCVAQREESCAYRWSVELVLESSDVYWWERDEVSTSCDCDVIPVLECPWKIHISETGHV